MIVHSSNLSCPVRVSLNRKKDVQAIEGLCTIVAHEGKDIGSAIGSAPGVQKNVWASFTFTGGFGGWAGISGTTPFQTSIVFERRKEERSSGRVCGLAKPDVYVALAWDDRESAAAGSRSN